MGFFLHASSVMFERLGKDQPFKDQTKNHINKYAEAGLCTLVIVYRPLDGEEYKTWEEEFLKAKTSVSLDRDDLVDAAAEKIEQGLILLGATTVEDKLQKGVRAYTLTLILFSDNFLLYLTQQCLCFV